MLTDKNQIYDFVKESNAIEGIHRPPTQEEIHEFERFICLEVITIEELKKFVSVYQPNARLREYEFDDVLIGSYFPPKGGPAIIEELNDILIWGRGWSPNETHIDYELLHPFTDCNGRSGRALWAWKRKNITGGFLLNFYYDQLQKEGERKDDHSC